MAVSILVMTPVKSFGELIQQALQDTDLYRVTLVHAADQMLDHATDPFSVVVLDLDLETEPVSLIEKLKEVRVDLRIIAMKDESSQTDSGLKELSLAGFLDGAFYLPDLLDALELVTADLNHKTIKAVKSEGSPTAFPSTATSEKRTTKLKPAPEWLQDVDRAAQHLTRLSLESAAQAALITRGPQLWAYAGQLPQPAADELAESVAHYWTRDGGSDFARFIRLDASNSEYMLYATGLGGDYVLALAFETEMPFSEIRSQAGNLARELAHPPKDSEPVKINLDPPKNDPGTLEESQPNLIATSLITEDFQLEQNNTEIPIDWRPDQDVAEGRQAFFEELLSSVEIPNPEGVAAQVELEEIESDGDQPPAEKQTKIEDEQLSRLAALLQTSDEQDEGFPEIGGNDSLVVDQDTTLLDQPNDDLHVSAESSDEHDLPIDAVSLANLIHATIDDELPEIDLFTADFDEDEPVPEVFTNFLNSPLQDDVPDYLVDVSLEPEEDYDSNAAVAEAPQQQAETDSKFPIPRSLIDIMQQQGDIENEDALVSSNQTETSPPDSTEVSIEEPLPVAVFIENDPADNDDIDDEIPPLENVQKIEIDSPPLSDDQEIPAHLADTIPTDIEETPVKYSIPTLKSEGIESVNPALHNLVYACVLVPRIPQHHLVGDLAIYLNQWVVQLGLAFGWRLAHISVRPNYLHWVAAVPPATSPGHMVRNLREHASQRIFAEFPRLARENPSGDFWAPGYLIINGQTPLSHGVVQDFIGKTRQQQGSSLARHTFGSR
jgi:REP element-mobilizing transposase RayT